MTSQHISELLGPLPTADELLSFGATPDRSKSGPLTPDCGPVCVTGASGFIALHIVSSLLEKGYSVVAAVRVSSKAPQLSAWAELFPGKLVVIEGCDLLVPGSFNQAITGCVGVFHTASPFFPANDKGLGVSAAGWHDLVIPAVMGTRNVLNACRETGTVKRVVLTASFACMVNAGNPAFPPDCTYGDHSWNITSLPNADLEWTQPGPGLHAYRYSKLLAEKTAWEFARESSFDLVAINPPWVVGGNITHAATPSELNESSAMVYKWLTAGVVLPPDSTGFVDVSDVAKAHILVYETEACGGNRYLTCAPAFPWASVSATLQALAPESSGVAKPAAEDSKKIMHLDNSRIVSLGMVFLSAEEAIRSQVVSLLKLFPEIRSPRESA